jgi:hypothetical protein
VVTAFEQSDVGLVRENNEDSFLSRIVRILKAAIDETNRLIFEEGQRVCKLRCMGNDAHYGCGSWEIHFLFFAQLGRPDCLVP